jgi:calcineurin-like phosphoesterase family protein
MTTWFTSDPHYGHRNIIGFSHRPFMGVDDMNASLIRRWNDVVQPGDTVFVLGDFALGPAGMIGIAGQLVGHKILVPGNHDRCWYGNGPGHKLWEAEFLRAGFDEIRQGVVEYDLLGRSVKLCHFPYVGDSHDSDRFIPYRPIDEGGWLLHGHIHTSWLQQDRMVNVGVDVWNYRPVADHELAELIDTYDALDRGLAEQAERSRIMEETERQL